MLPYLGITLLLAGAIYGVVWINGGAAGLAAGGERAAGDFAGLVEDELLEDARRSGITFDDLDLLAGAKVHPDEHLHEWEREHHEQQQQQQGGGGSQAAGSGWRSVPESERISSCDIEAVAPWQAVCCLTPDATQLADAAWSPFGTAGSSAPAAAQPEAVQRAAESARRGDIPPLRVLAVDVLAATADGRDRWAVLWKMLGEQCFRKYCLVICFSALS